MKFNFFIKNTITSNKFYMHSSGAGIYHVNIDKKSLNVSCLSRFEKKMVKQKSEIIRLDISKYVLLSREEQEVLQSDNFLNVNNSAYKNGIDFEFNLLCAHCEYLTNTIFSEDLGKKYWVLFLAGILDSNKSYTIHIEDVDNYYLDIILNILNYLEFKYKTIYIDSKYLQILTKNPYCKISSF